MDYITASTDEAVKGTDSIRIRKIHEKVRRIRASEKAGVKYMQWWEELAYAREDGQTEGMTKGKAAGEEIKLIKQVCKKIEKGREVDKIAEELEEEVNVILPIYESAKKCAPEYDSGKIYAILRKEAL